MPAETLRPLGTYQLQMREGSGALRRIPFFLGGMVPAGQTLTFKAKVPADGTIEKLQVRIYRGPELALEITPYVANAKGHRRELLTFSDLGRKAIVGDDDHFIFDVMEPVYAMNDDFVYVQAQNKGGFDYDFAVMVEIDFAGGAWPRWTLAGEGR